MPAIDVKAPNGRVYRLNAPDDATQEQIDQKVKEFGQQMQADPYTTHEQLYGLPPGLLKATAEVESGPERAAALDSSAVSRTGVRGLMQITKTTGKHYGLTAKNFTDPLAQIDAAAQLHRDNLKAAGGDLKAAIARYGDPKETGYADKVLARMGQGAGAAPAGSEGPGTPSPASVGRTWPAAPQPGLLARAGAALKDVAVGEYGVGSQLTRGAQDLDRFGYSIIGTRGGLFAEPSAYKAALERRGFPGASRVRTDLPHGFLEHLGAATGLVGEVALQTTPGGRVVFGLGVLAREASQSDLVGDAVEGTAGAVLLARDLYRLGKLVPRAVRALSGPGRIGRALVTTPAEESYLAAKETAAVTEKTATEARAAATAFQVKVDEAQAQAHAVASSAESAAKAHVEQAVAEHRQALEHVGQLERDLVTPADTIRQKMALGAGPKGAEAGEMLRAVGEDVTALAPPGAEEVGVTAAAARLAKQRRGLYTAFEAKADALGVHLPAGSAEEGHSAGAGLIRRRAVQYAKDLIHGQGSASERSVAREFSMLGVQGLKASDGTFFQVKTPAKLREMLEIDPTMEVVYGDVPLSELSRLYARARTIALSPREYPVSGQQAKRSYSRLLSATGGTIRALAGADPELSTLYTDAQRFVRRVEKPFLAETARKVLAPGRTPQGAFDLLLADDPTTITRIFTHASGPEREAYSHAIFHELVASVTNDLGEVDRAALAARFAGLPRETRELLGGFANGAAKLVVDEAVAQQRAVTAGQELVRARAETVTTAKEGLREVRGRKRELLAGMAAVKREYLRRAARDVQAALEAARTAERKVHQLAEEPRKGSRMVVHFARGMRMFGKMHAVMAVVDAIHGNIARALLQAGEAAIFLRRPRLVKEALETPIATPRGRELAAALHTLLQRHLGPPQREEGSGPVLRPGQTLPAPAPGEAAAEVQRQPAAGGGAVVSPARPGGAEATSPFL